MVTARREVSGAVDDVTFYLTSIARFDLLTAEEEVDLAQTIEDGRAGSKRLATGERLSAGERVILQNAVRAGEQAHSRFLNSSLRLVVAHASKFRWVQG